MSAKLVDGLIPSHTPCPFKDQCPCAADVPTTCGHLGEEHTVAYSCAYARLFEIIDRRKERQERLDDLAK